MPPATAFATGLPSTCRPEGKIRELIVQHEAVDGASRTEERLHGRRHRYDVSIAVDHHKMGSAGGLASRIGAALDRHGLASGGCRARDVADQGGPSRDVMRLDHSLHGHCDELGIRDVLVPVRIHQPARHREQEPGLRIVRTALCDIRAIEDREHLQERDAGGGRRRHADQVNEIGAAQRFGDPRLIGVEVGRRQGTGARLGLRARDDRVAKRRLEQGARALAPDAAQRRGIGRIPERVARLDLAAIGAREEGAHVGLARLRRIAIHESRHALRHCESGLGRADRRLEELLPGQRAVPRVHGAEHRDRSRHAGRSSGKHGIPIRQRLTLLIDEHVRCRAGGRRFAPVESRELFRCGVVIKHEPAAADPRALRLDETEHRLDRDRRIGRAAAGRQHFESRIDRERIRRRDTGCSRTGAGGGRRRGRSRGGCRRIRSRKRLRMACTPKARVRQAAAGIRRERKMISCGPRSPSPHYGRAAGRFSASPCPAPPVPTPH